MKTIQTEATMTAIAKDAGKASPSTMPRPLAANALAGGVLLIPAALQLIDQLKAQTGY